MDQEPTFFDFAAEVGLTKHLGGVEATETLVELCHLGEGSYVLDVGCGAGVTPCYLARQHGCRVVGVDILPAMVQRCRERAAREQVADQARFLVADAQALPFRDSLFDAVITESATAFPEDKERALREYARVTKPGGHVGLNESTWLKMPPPPEVVAWASQDVGANVKPLTSDEWRALLQGAGLKEVAARVTAIETEEEARGIVRRYGCRGMLGIMGRTMRLYARSQAYRRFVQEVTGQGITPKDLGQYFGYGIYVGRK